jgi:hypothetical protein
LDDAVKVAESGFGLGENIESTEARRLLSLSELDTGPERAGHGELSILEGELSGHKELAVKVQEGNIIRDGEGNLRKDEVQSLQPCFNLACHAVSYLRLYAPAHQTIGQNLGIRKLSAGPLSGAPVGAKNRMSEAAVRPAIRRGAVWRV